MNPFIIGSSLLFERFDQAFQDHERIFRDLRQRHRIEMEKTYLPRHHNERVARTPPGHVNRDIRPLSIHVDSSEGCPRSKRRSSTLAREGIQALGPSTFSSGSAASSSGQERKVASARSSREVEERQDAVKHLGYNWFEVSRTHGGVLTMKGRHLCLEAHRDRSFLCMYGLKASTSRRLPFTSHMRCECKLHSQTVPLLNLVLQFTSSTSSQCYKLVRLDFSQRSACLQSIKGVENLPHSAEDVRSLESLACQPASLPGLNKFFALHVQATLDDGENVRIKVEVGDLVVIDAVCPLDIPDVRNIHVGVLVMRGGALVLKDVWTQVDGQEADNSSSSKPYHATRAQSSTAKPLEGRSSARATVSSSTSATPANALANTSQSQHPLLSKLHNLPFDPALLQLVAQDLVLPPSVGKAGAGALVDALRGVAGQQQARSVLTEAVLLPLLLPQFFSGLRQPWKGVLLFGPPGTGKTLLARAMSQMFFQALQKKGDAETQGGCFLHLSISTLTSKWRGEGEKLVRCVFEVARLLAPTLIFLDEADALLGCRGEGSGDGGGGNEHEASRRLKSEFLVQLDGLNTGGSAAGRVLLLCASNLPWSLDAAFLRRLERRVYLPLPGQDERRELISMLLAQQSGDVSLEDADLDHLVALSDGFSQADITTAMKAAAMRGGRRALGIAGGDSSAEGEGGLMSVASWERLLSGAGEAILERGAEPMMSLQDLELAFQTSRPSVHPSLVPRYEDWNSKFGLKGEGEL